MNKEILLISFEIGVVKGFENVRSAHVQLFYKLAELLHKNNYNIKIATNKLRKNTKIDAKLVDIPIFFIPDPIKRKEKNVMESGFSKRLSIFNIIRSLFTIYLYCLRNRNTTVHFVNGSLGVGLFAGFLKVLGLKNNIIWTPSVALNSENSFIHFILSKLNYIISSTDYISGKINSKGLRSRTIKHGLSRNFNIRKVQKRRITFWRDPSYENGADIALDVFIKLSKKFPNIIFTMLLRPHWANLVNDPGLDNVEIYNYPYPNDVSLDFILSESICCLFPFRELSTNPQLCILESLSCGVPCFVSDIESVSEYTLNKEFLLENIDTMFIVNKISVYLEKIKSGGQTIVIPPHNAGFNWEDFLLNHVELYNN